MTLEEFIKRADEVEAKTDFVVSWFAKKYNKTIFRVGNMNHCLLYTSPSPRD